MYFKTTAINLSLLAASKLSFLPTLYATSSNILRGGSSAEERASHKDCTLLIKMMKLEDDSEHQEVECETEDGTFIPFKDMPDVVVEAFKEGSIVSNVDVLRVYRDTSSLGVQNGGTKAPTIIKGDANAFQNRRKRFLQQGVPQQTLALWIQAADVSTTTPMDNGAANCLTDEVFGTYGDSKNLVSKYRECSYDKTIFEAFDGTTSTGAAVSNGVYAVTIPNTVSGTSDGVIRNAATNAATTALGPLGGSSGQFDYVLVCIPPGTSGGWIGYAYINHWLSVYNDVWCNYLSIQMHEIGHNLGLAHSGETATYDDQSGMMGYSYGQDDGPNMCFNAPKNWQLGWYADKSHQLNSGDYNWSGKLYGIDDYGSTMSNDGNIIIRLAGSSEDFYVSFNKQNGINSGTREGGNRVLVHSRASGTGYGTSVLLAKLSAGGSYTANIDGVTVPISVNSLTTGNTGFAEVQIGSPVSDPPTSSPTQPPTVNPTNAPTQLPTNGPTGQPVSSPTKAPTRSPTNAPTQLPTNGPTGQPVSSPTKAPTSSPPTKAPTSSPTDSPTTRAPTTTPTTRAPTTSPDPCEDDPNDIFYWERRGKEKTCQWLMDRRGKRQVCQEVNGGNNLPPAREVCNYTCQDWLKFELRNGREKTCRWLKKRLLRKPNLCERHPNAVVVCPDACGNCD